MRWGHLLRSKDSNQEAKKPESLEASNFQVRVGPGSGIALYSVQSRVAVGNQDPDGSMAQAQGILIPESWFLSHCLTILW
jgi:hypothetical protein